MSHIPNNRHNPSISAQHPDSSFFFPCLWYDPSRRLLKHLRAYQRQSVRRGLVAHVRRKWHAAHYHLWAIVCGTDIPINTQIGVGLLLPHPQGVVIHPD
ncbi:MAG: hypothetical protein KDA60_09615, partial [Planctomycetales bacterium]|nr:hypothetical protein [Planctomycetales bacterium]